MIRDRQVELLLDTEHRVPTVYMVYTQGQLDYLQKNRRLPRSLLVTRFNKRFGTNKNIIAINSVCKRKGWLTGRNSFFTKGHKPWNIGTKGVCKRNSGCFRRGQRPKNWKPVGSERINTGDGCILIKVAEPNVWRYKHVVVWESEHGKVEKGQLIRFIDGNQLNCSLDNLEQVSRPMHLYLNRNGYGEMPGRLKPSMKAVAEIVVKVAALRRGMG